MRRKWIAVFLSLILMFTLTSEAFAAMLPPPSKTSCGNGNGTVLSPHRICNQADFMIMQMYSNQHFILNNGITMNQYWTPIPHFTGTLNGNNQSITGLRDSLFEVNYGTIKNLNLKSVNIPHDFRGALAFITVGYISNVKVDGYVGGWSAGGIAQLNNGVIEQVTASLTVGGKAGTGGIVSTNGQNGIIRRSYFSGNAGAFAQSGGIVAHNEGRIENTLSWGRVSVVSGGAGGIAASNSPTGVIINSAAYGNVYYMYDPTYVGKLVGSNSGTIINSKGTGQIIKTQY